ncbi:MAG TPA: fumarate reductase subunit FrdD [Candidatus Xenobia bacterium]|nr:fumarate reductase subunit FrdD [Candidatus Xenobia bacterium]
MRRDPTPLLWLLFSAGGTFAAFFFAAQLFIVGIAWPLGIFSPPDYATALALARHPLARLYLLASISLPLFHAGHRFRYTLYDGLMLKHLTIPIVIGCYGVAMLATLAAAWILFSLP